MSALPSARFSARLPSGPHALPDALSELVDALRLLPGVGVKSAQRMAYHLLQHDRTAALQLAQALEHAVHGIRHCTYCHTFTDLPVCSTCQDPERDHRVLCVVETPADQAAIERTGSYRGLYFVLMGKLSPLDGVGVHDIGLPALLTRVLHPQAMAIPSPSESESEAAPESALDQATQPVKLLELLEPLDEVIVATSFTAEGEVTAHAIAEALRPHGVKVTRLARGVPVGSELEYVDLSTIAHAFSDRR